MARRIAKPKPVPVADGAVKPRRRTRFETRLAKLLERLEAEGKSVVDKPRSILDEIDESRPAEDSSGR
jgi:hypothetical protein